MNNISISNIPLVESTGPPDGDWKQTWKSSTVVKDSTRLNA